MVEPSTSGASMFGPCVSKRNVFGPLIFLAVLFAAELMVLSVWLDTATLSTQSILSVGIGVAGPRILRAVVGFSAVFVTFAFIKYGALLGAVPQRGSPRWRIRLSLLGAHFAAMAVFACMSFLLFSNKFPLAESNAAALGWLAAGLLSIALAALAFVPGGAWIHLVRTTGSLWIYALLAAVAVSLANNVSESIWRPLSKLTFQLVGAMLKVFVSPVLTDAAKLRIRAPHFGVVVSPQCSGFEGMGLILAFGIVWLLLFRKECRFPQALLLLPAGMVFIYLLNAVRIAVLVLIGNAGAPQIATGGFHSQAGWIAFAAASLAFSFAARQGVMVLRASDGRGVCRRSSESYRALPGAVSCDPGGGHGFAGALRRLRMALHPA